jgi:hypothetical protein
MNHQRNLTMPWTHSQDKMKNSALKNPPFKELWKLENDTFMLDQPRKAASYNKLHTGWFNRREPGDISGRSHSTMS